MALAAFGSRSRADRRLVRRARRRPEDQLSIGCTVACDETVNAGLISAAQSTHATPSGLPDQGFSARPSFGSLPSAGSRTDVCTILVR